MPSLINCRRSTVIQDFDLGVVQVIEVILDYIRPTEEQDIDVNQMKI